MPARFSRALFAHVSLVIALLLAAVRVAGDSVPLHAQQEGRVVSIAAREGAFVEKGAELFRLDESSSRLERTRLQTEMERTREQIALIAAQRERAGAAQKLRHQVVGREAPHRIRRADEAHHDADGLQRGDAAEPEGRVDRDPPQVGGRQARLALAGAEQQP